MIGSFLFAASYWNINFARNSDTNQLTNFFVLLSIILFVKLVKTNMLRFVFLLFFFSSLAIFSYRTATVFLPIFLLVSFIFYFNNFKIKTKIVYIFLLVFLSIGILFSFSIILKRFNSQGVNAYPEMLSLQGEEIREDGNLGSTYVTRFFHSKVFDLTRLYSRKYFENLNPTFLFFKGDASLNNSIVNEPLFYAFEIILFSFGLYVFAKKFNKNDKLSLIFPLIILIVPLSTAPTVDNPNASRMLVSQYGFIYFISLGIMYILHFKFEGLKKISLLLCVFAYFYYISYLTHEYYVHKPVHQPWFRNLGNEELIQDLEKMKNKYQKVYFDKNFVTEYLFLSHYDPVKLQERIAKFGNYNYAKKTMSILDDKYVQLGGACRFTDGEKNVLYVCSSSQIPIKSKIIKVYRFKDQQINYILLEYDKNGKFNRILPLNVSFL